MKKLIVLTILAALSSATRAQVDFTGEWSPVYHEDAPERIPGPELGDYMGLPLNDAARLRADSWDADRISMIMQYQCRPHSSDYGMRGLGNMRVLREIEPLHQNVVSFRTYMPAWGSERTIWLDGRDHPPAYAEHTFQGFSTGRWEGNTLVITTTHLKENYFRRNGVASSDQRTVTEYWMRHGDILTVVTAAEDPVFLTEPLVRSQNWYIDPGQQLPQMYCEYVTEVAPPTPDTVPHHLPGQNPYLAEVAGWYGLPYAATRGGSHTMYPEFRQTMGEPEVKPPLMCERFCMCSNFFECLANAPRLAE